MKQWGGDQNYRPEKKPSADKKARRSASRETAETSNKTERDYRVGKTIAGATNNARKRNLEHIAARKKQQRKNALIVLCILIILVSVGIMVGNYIAQKAAEREAALTEEEGFLDLSGMKIKEFTGELLEYVEEPEERVKVRTVIDTKAQNRKPGARISPSALKECIIELPLKDIAKINLAVIFE